MSEPDFFVPLAVPFASLSGEPMLLKLRASEGSRFLIVERAYLADLLD
jgi:hypothetical protein